MLLDRDHATISEICRIDAKHVANDRRDSIAVPFSPSKIRITDGLDLPETTSIA